MVLQEPGGEYSPDFCYVYFYIVMLICVQLDVFHFKIFLCKL